MLAMKQGLCASRLVLPSGCQGGSVFAYLCQTFPHISQATWRQRFLTGEVLLYDNGDYRPLGIDEALAWHKNKILYYYRTVENEVAVPFAHRIIFENERLLVADKPHFLTTAPAGQYAKETLLSRLKDSTNNGELSPIHRLDRQTAGLVVFCKAKRWRGVYQTLFAKQHIQKTYHAIAPYLDLDYPLTLSLPLCRGVPFYTMQVGGGQINSCTVIELLGVNLDQTLALYKLRPTTGKMHQLRVHMTHLGMPIKNDNFYPQVIHKTDDDFSQPLQLLAKTLRFTDPIDGVPYYFVSDFSLDF